MPRNYVRAIGKKPYSFYTKEQLDNALIAVHRGKPLREVAENYGVPRSTLSRHMNKKNTGKYGRPPVFDEKEEATLAESISLAADWGFPLSKYDIRCLVKNHLDRKGLEEKRFKNNFPGPDWTQCFMERHKDQLTERLCQNIKRSRAAVDADTIDMYFDKLLESMNDVDPALIVNYDETNLTDDPKRQRVVVRRSCRHPEKIIDSSKSSTSVMFSAAGDGTVLPVYINYKSDHLYDTWCNGGPSGAVYNRTKSGWFTMEIFEDWFKKIILPYFRNMPKDKPKVIIGDNLASHVSQWVIQKCVEENIRFVLLPPNSTGICQPLDVAFFKPLKTQWSKILADWKMKNRGVVPKDTFPRLLKKCLQEMSSKTGDNIRAGFKGSGLVPLDRTEVLKRLPQKKTTSLRIEGQDWVDSFTGFLKEFRQKETQPLRQVKKKRLNIQPGASVSNIDEVENSIKKVPKTKENLKKRKCQKSETETDTDATISLQDSDCDVRFVDLSDEQDYNFDGDTSILNEFSDPLMELKPVPSTSKAHFLETLDTEHAKVIFTSKSDIVKKATASNKAVLSEVNVNIAVPEKNETQDKLDLSRPEILSPGPGDFVIVRFIYNEKTKKQIEKRFIGKVIDAVKDTHVFVSVMRKSSKAENMFIFPQVTDEQLVAPENVLAKIDPLSISRGRYLFPKFIKEYSCS